MQSTSRTWPHHLRSVIEEEVEEMLKLGVIEPSLSTWHSHPVLVPQPDGSTQFCIEFRQLSSISKFDAYPMPTVQNLLEKMVGPISSCFSI